MVVLAKEELEQISLPFIQKPIPSSLIPVIDLSNPNSKSLIVAAAQELGFFKVINHGVSMEIMSALESEAMKFFALPQSEKEIRGLSPLGYGSKKIGSNGDLGWVEYLLLEIASKPKSQSSQFCSTLNEYIKAVRKLSVEILEMMAQGLHIEEKEIFSKLVMDEESDSVLRFNHYPPCPHLLGLSNRSLTGFGEHTDPQLISILRSNNTSGLEIALKDGSWVSVPSDPTSFFVNVGDSLQVLTNGRFRSVKHRVMVNSARSRLSMIYFGGPPPGQKLGPSPLLMEEREQSLYREFTWKEYKSCAFRTRLADNRLVQFER
ncbi:hypothetical protein LUZ61_005895 [Rhynchospora tenuis]|uniref:gibberellin 2beta-dioxygenase n=1 Tax=Rhynchospora tenuis TaxID=198213 RepID=A0AAD6EV54_9POAL|nr:hypothetical protein LUZ61_005895 [Rhynchospora tenuis]